MRRRRVNTSVVSVAGLVISASLAVVPAAEAAGGTTIYVDNASTANCSDSAAGAGSSTTPFCTMQAALLIVQPGDTILVGSVSQSSFTISTSGTAVAPITIGHMPGSSPQPETNIVSSGSEPAITISGAEYVDISGLQAIAGTGSALLITGSSHVTLDSSAFSPSMAPTTADTQPVVHVTGGSSYVTISRDVGYAIGSGGLIAVDGGGTGDVITTNYLPRSLRGSALAVDGASNMVITSNTMNQACGAGIQITGGSTATLENNVVSNMLGPSNSRTCTVQPSAAHGLLVDASSATGSTSDYNVVDATSAGTGALPYSWGGTSYMSAADLTSATGQGAHDIDSAAIPNPATMNGTSPALIDSANADAPGELSTDYLGHARVDDPLVPNTGAGAHTYYDRGAVETLPAAPSAYFEIDSAGYVVTTASVGGSVTAWGQVMDPWGGKLTCDFAFGDGTGATVAATGDMLGTCATKHQYTKTGQYTPTLSLTYSDGSTKQVGWPITVDAAAPLVTSLQVTATGSTTVTPSCSATSGWDIANTRLDFGDGHVSSSCGPHTYQRPGTYYLKFTANDASGASVSSSTSFVTPGNWYTPLTPARILDTRNGTGTGSIAKVPANGVLKLKVAGAGGVPSSGANAVVLNVTVTGPTAGGYLTVYPDGTPRPATSNLNFAAGQTVPNTVIVKVGADGYVDLANVAAGSTNLVTDVQGYYSRTGSSGYVTTAPTQVLDTRAGKTTIPSGGTVQVNLGTGGYTAAALNITVANAQAGGYITAYPDGQPMPKASNVNFSAGRTIQNEAITKIGADGIVDFTNTSGGTADLIVDVTGYFSPGLGLGFVPISPSRLLDTRASHGGSGPVAAGATQSALVTGDAAITPGTAAAIAANITVTAPTGSGYITVYPDEIARPDTTVLYFNPGQTIPNATTVSVGKSGGSDLLYNGSNGSVQLIADVFGFYN